MYTQILLKRSPVEKPEAPVTKIQKRIEKRTKTAIRLIEKLFKHWEHWKLLQAFSRFKILIENLGKEREIQRMEEAKKEAAKFFEGSLLRKKVHPDLNELRLQFARDGRHSRLNTGYGAHSRNAVRLFERNIFQY